MNRFKNYFPGKDIATQNKKQDKKIIITYFSDIQFFHKIQRSLWESGYRIKTVYLLIIFAAYLIGFFYLGYNLSGYYIPGFESEAQDRKTININENKALKEGMALITYSDMGLERPLKNRIRAIVKDENNEVIINDLVGTSFLFEIIKILIEDFDENENYLSENLAAEAKNKDGIYIKKLTNIYLKKYFLMNRISPDNYQSNIKEHNDGLIKYLKEEEDKYEKNFNIANNILISNIVSNITSFLEEINFTSDTQFMVNNKLFFFGKNNILSLLGKLETLFENSIQTGKILNTPESVYEIKEIASSDWHSILISSENIKLKKDVNNFLRDNKKEISSILWNSYYSFENTLLDNFKIFIISFLTEQFFYKVDISNFTVYQLTVFRLSFGIIFLFIGSLIFLVFIYPFLSNLSLKRMRDDLPKWIQVFANSIQAGLSFEQAFDFSLDKIKRDPLLSIATETAASYKIYRDIKLAFEPFEVWEKKIPEIKMFTSALKIQQEKGGNIIPLLYSLIALFNKKVLLTNKIESIASEAIGQLKIIFVLSFFLIFYSEIIFGSFKGIFSPFFSFCSYGGGLNGLLFVFGLHFFLFLLLYIILVGGVYMVQREMVV